MASQGADRLPDRVDFAQTPSCVVIVQFWRRRGRTIAPYGGRVREADFDVEAALEKLEGMGYTVRRFAGGARAWKGTPEPVRTRHQIIERRARAWRRVGEGGALLSSDFAFDG